MLTCLIESAGASTCILGTVSLEVELEDELLVDDLELSVDPSVLRLNMR